MTSDGSRSYSYDSENKQTVSGTGQLHYDPFGRLDGAGTTPGAPPVIAYESYVDGLIAERTPGSSSVISRHVFGPGGDEPIVWYNGAGTSDRRFLHADERGSIVAVTSGAAALLNINRYDEYGRAQWSNASYVDRFAYTGQRYFSGSGVSYYKNRMFDTKSGRFMQTDPIGYGGGMNPYAYAGGDPVNATDPLGLEPEGGGDIDICGGYRDPKGRCVDWPGPGGFGGSGSFGGVAAPLAPSDLITADTPSISRPTCDTPGADQSDCDPVVNGPPKPQLPSILPPLRLSFAPTQTIPGLSQSECAAVVWGLVAAGLEETVEAAIHILRGASIVETFFAVSSAAATARFVLIGVAAGGTIYILDRLTGGTISSKIGRMTGICR